MNDQQLSPTIERSGQNVSHRALSIARLIDRLEPGRYSIQLNMLNLIDGGDWGVEVLQVNTIHKKILPPPAT